MATGTERIHVLLVEDNPADARLAQETLKTSRFKPNVTLAEDGETALAMLKGEGDHAGVARPDLILLDLRLPNMDGQTVLQNINEDENLVNIPVIILTGTEAEQSLLHSYNVPPSRFWRKPIRAANFDLAISQIPNLSKQPIRLETPARSAEPVAAQASSEPKKRKWWPF